MHLIFYYKNFNEKILPGNPKSPVTFSFEEYDSPIKFNLDEGRELKAAPKGVKYETFRWIWKENPGDLPLNQPDERRRREFRVADLQLYIFQTRTLETKNKVRNVDS